MEGVTETKFTAEMEGSTIHRLTHLGIHPINNYQTQTLLHMPARFCWQDPDISISCEALPVPGKYRSGIVIYWMEHRAPNEGARESTQGAKGVCNPIGGTTIWTNQYPQSCASSCICSRRWPSRPSLGREALGLAKIICPSTGECQDKEAGVGRLGSSVWEGYKGVWG